jgi:hypothetical protein
MPDRKLTEPGARLSDLWQAVSMLGLRRTTQALGARWRCRLPA